MYCIYFKIRCVSRLAPTLLLSMVTSSLQLGVSRQRKDTRPGWPSTSFTSRRLLRNSWRPDSLRPRNPGSRLDPTQRLGGKGIGDTWVGNSCNITCCIVNCNCKGETLHCHPFIHVLQSLCLQTHECYGADAF